MRDTNLAWRPIVSSNRGIRAFFWGFLWALYRCGHGSRTRAEIENILRAGVHRDEIVEVATGNAPHLPVEFFLSEGGEVGCRIADGMEQRRY